MAEMGDEPVGHELVENAAMEERVAVEIGETLPGNDRFERGRLQVGHEPLIDREIGDAGEPDRARAPRLPCRPFDRIVEVGRLLERPRLALPG
jgi:hypothetical protein